MDILLIGDIIKLNEEELILEEAIEKINASNYETFISDFIDRYEFLNKGSKKSFCSRFAKKLGDDVGRLSQKMIEASVVGKSYQEIKDMYVSLASKGVYSFEEHYDNYETHRFFANLDIEEEKKAEIIKDYFKSCLVELDKEVDKEIVTKSELHKCEVEIKKLKEALKIKENEKFKLQNILK